MIRFALRRSQNIHWQALEVTREARAALKHQKAAVLWFTGLSGAGKSTIANILERKLALEGRHTCLLDGDNVRHGLNRDLGFTGIDSPYESPENPEIRINTGEVSPEDAADLILTALRERGFV